MVARPWEAELALSETEARKLIAAAFPELASASIEPYGVGWDNTAFLVGGELVFRFPRRQLGAECLDAEIRVLPGLAARRLPLAVPDPVYVGRPTATYPWSFAGYRRLEGTTACAARLDEPARHAAAAPLGCFLAALHAITAAEAQEFGAPPDLLDRLGAAKRVPQIRERLRQVVELGLIDDNLEPYEDVLTEDAVARPSRAVSLVHGDLYVRHLLVDAGRRPCGVIDWGDVHVGDPAVDLAIAHSFLPPSAHPAFRRAYGEIDDATWCLARFRALFSAVAIVVYGHDVGDEDLVREGLAGLGYLASREVDR